MARRILGVWIGIAFVTSSLGAAHYRPGDGQGVVTGGTAAAVWADPRVDSERTDPASSPAGAGSDAPTTSTTTVASSTTTTTTATSPEPPSDALLIAHSARVDAPGVYIVRRDGSGLRRLLTGCRMETFRQWLGDDEVLLYGAGQASPPSSRLRLDGAQRALAMPPVTDRFDRTALLPGRGSPSPDGRQLAVPFGGATIDFGVAFVDLEGQAANVVLWGDNPEAFWSPTGDHVLLLGPDVATLLDSHGGTARPPRPSPLDAFSAGSSWSPDGRLLVGPGRSNPNRLVVFDPWSGTSRDVPGVGPGFNTADWAGASRLVIAEPGIDHQVPAAIHLYDLRTGQTQRLADAAYLPEVPVDGRVVAFQDRQHRHEIDLVGIDGRGRSTLVAAPEGYWVSPHSWSPSGEWLQLDVCNN